jgi:hypothetical protein
LHDLLFPSLRDITPSSFASHLTTPRKKYSKTRFVPTCSRPEAEGEEVEDAGEDEELEKELLAAGDTPIIQDEVDGEKEAKPDSPVHSSNSEREEKRFYDSTPSRELSQDKDLEKLAWNSTSRESSADFKLSGLRQDSLSSVEEFKAQAAQASQKVMNWGVRLLQGGTDLVEKTKTRLVKGSSEDQESKPSDEEKEEDPPQFLAPERPKRTVSPMGRSPTRTPVTSNDPLGALGTPEDKNHQHNSLPPNVRLSPVHDQPDVPVLTTPSALPSSPRRVSMSSYGSNSSLDSPLPGTSKLASSLSSISTNLRKSMRFGKTFGFRTPVSGNQRPVARQLLTPQEGAEFHRCNTHTGLVDANFKSPVSESAYRNVR